MRPVQRKPIRESRSSLFWDFTQRRLVVSNRRLGLTYPSQLQRSSLTFPDGTDRLSRNQSTLRNIPEEQRSHLHRGGNLKWPILELFWRRSRGHINSPHGRWGRHSVDTPTDRCPPQKITCDAAGLVTLPRPAPLRSTWIYDPSCATTFKDRDITFNAQRHRGTLLHIRTAFIRKRPDMLHDNAGTLVARTDSTTAQSMPLEGVIPSFRRKELSPCDLHLFDPFKKRLKGRRFESNKDFKAAVLASAQKVLCERFKPQPSCGQILTAFHPSPKTIPERLSCEPTTYT
jgi:hypothetical protein